jgi:hypothetical protein
MGKEKRKNNQHTKKTLEGLLKQGIQTSPAELKEIAEFDYPTKINWDYVGKQGNVGIIAEYEGKDISRTHIEGHFLRAHLINKNKKIDFELVWIAETRETYDKIKSYYKVLSKELNLPKQRIYLK